MTQGRQKLPETLLTKLPRASNLMCAMVATRNEDTFGQEVCKPWLRRRACGF